MEKSEQVQLEKGRVEFIIVLRGQPSQQLVAFLEWVELKPVLHEPADTRDFCAIATIEELQRRFVRSTFSVPAFPSTFAQFHASPHG